MDNRNLIIAIALSLAVLIGWQYFVATPQINKATEQAAEQSASSPTATTPGPNGEVPAAGTPPAPAVETPALTRDQALAQSPRVAIETPSLSGSVALKGGRIDDLRLSKFHEQVDPASPTIVLLSPSGAADGYFAEFGWIGGASDKVPGPDTLWTAPANAKLTDTTPLTLTYDNGAGLTFTRTISVDADYMFTVTDGVANSGTSAVSITPYARVVRQGEPSTVGSSWILHQGLVGIFDEGEKEITYKELKDTPTMNYQSSHGWLGFTDKYWAATLVPENGKAFQARFSRIEQPNLFYQADLHEDAVSVPPGGKAEATNRLFAGAKQVSLLAHYRDTLSIDRFDNLIYWGKLWFLTKPMFFLIDWLYRQIGNFGLAILAVTILVKAVFFPLANKSYKSMSAMKKVQPQIADIRTRYKDDRVKQQQAMMELYKKEKINPLAGCWPVAVQIPVFFSLYSVLYVTIEMRHAPFFGWIHDLSAPDPTHIFNLFGLLPFDPVTVPVLGTFLAIGVWPIVMGITMFVQMRLNPTPPDPTQRVIFTWMPLIFTFMLGTFPAGLVIYWAWNNTLSVTQQYVIMRRQGVAVNLWGNIRETFRRTPAKAAAGQGGLPVAANDGGNPPQNKSKRSPKAKKANSAAAKS